MIKILKFIFHISLLVLIIISVWPGSLIGFFFYGDITAEANLVHNPYGTAINHFIFYIYVSFLGFFTYLKNQKFNWVVNMMFFLSLILELLHYVIPNRAFQVTDLLANILGVAVAYSVIKFYLLIKKNV